MPDSVNESPDSAETTRLSLFSARGITKIYEGDFTALDDINLDIYPGETVVISGANGSGKTVLTRILCALEKPDSGEVFFRGKPLNDTLTLARREIGVSFQDADTQILGDTVEEDLRFDAERALADTVGKTCERDVADRIEAALKAVGLADKRLSSPRRLSGGEKRRLQAAELLAADRSVVFTDEPFANLDYPGTVDVLKIIRDFKAAGKTLIILTHELDKVLAFADRLLILVGGKIVADGGPEEVLNGLKSEWGVRDPRVNIAKVEDCSWL